MDDFFTSYLIVAATLALGSAVQCAIGFGSGLVLTPILLMAGWSLPEVLAICFVAGMVQNIWGAIRLRHAFDWQTGWRPNAIRLLFLPVGIGTLYTAQATLDPAVIRQIVGVAVLLFVMLLVTGHVRPRSHIHFAWEFVAMASGGFLAGFCGMGGPPIVMWITAQGWSGDKARSFMFYAFSITLFPFAVMLVWIFGNDVLRAGGLAVLTIPWAYLGAWLGLTIGAHMPDQHFRRVTLLLLVAIGMSAIAGPSLLPRKDSYPLKSEGQADVTLQFETTTSSR